MNKLLKEANQMLKFWCLDADNSLEERAKKKLAEGGRIQVIAPNGDRCSVVRAGENMVQSWSEKRHQWESFPLSKCKILSVDNDATENGAIKQFGQSKETEVMPLEKKPVLAQDEKYRGDPKYMSLPGYKQEVDRINRTYEAESKKEAEYRKKGYGKARSEEQVNGYWDNEMKSLNAHYEAKLKAGHFSKDSPEQERLQRLNNLHVYEKLKEIVEENMKRYKPDHPEYKRLAGLSKKYGDEIKRYSKDGKFKIYEIVGVGLPDKLIGSIEADTPLQAQMKFISINPVFRNKNIKATKDNSPDKFGTVMKEFYEGKLKSGSGETVTDPQQAKAIAYSESKDEEPVYTLGTKDGQFKKIDEIQKEINDLESEIFGKDKELKSILKETNHPENKIYNPRKQELHKLKGRLDKMKKQLENLKSGKNADGKERKNTHDEKTYQHGEHVKVVNRSTGDKIELKVLRDNKDGTLEVKAPTGAVLTIKKAWVVDATTILDECMEVLKLSGFATDAYDPKNYEGTRRHETNIWYLENEVTKWRSRYESAKDQVTAYRKMVSSGQYGKLTTEDLKRAERDLEAARMKLEQSLSMLQRAKGQKDEDPNNQ